MISLNLEGNKINTLKGIEKLAKLTSLNLTNNEIIDITPLSANTALTILDLRGNAGIDGNRANYMGERLEALNKIGEILDRGGTINIDTDKLGLFDNYKKLNLNFQNLTTLEVLEGFTELTSLIIYNNAITLEDKESQEILKSMTKLTELNMSYNKVTNITAINSLGNLKDLNLLGTNNKVNLAEIEDIISNLNSLQVTIESLKTIVNCERTKITALNLHSSSLTEIPNLSIFTELVELSLSYNPGIINFGIVSEVTSLQRLSLSNNNLHGKMIDFSKLTNLTNLDLSSNTLWSEDLENLKALKNNENLTINLSNNSIIDATALLELDPNTKINLSNNVNLSRDSKDKLKARFGNNVTF